MYLPSELWGLTKEEARDLTQMYSLIFLSVSASVCILFLFDFLSSDMDSERIIEA